MVCMVWEGCKNEGVFLTVNSSCSGTVSAEGIDRNSRVCGQKRSKNDDSKPFVSVPWWWYNGSMVVVQWKHGGGTMEAWWWYNVSMVVVQCKHGGGTM